MKSWKNISPILSAALLWLALTTNAWATTYTVSGATYDPAKLSGIYTGAVEITGSFTTASPLPPNLNGAPIGGSGGLGLVTGWSFNDGVFTYTDLNSDIWQNGKAAAGSFAVSTDPAGNITAFFIVLTIPKSGAAVGQPTEFLFLGFSGPGTSGAVAASTCVVVASDGSCQGYNGALAGVANSTVPGTAVFTASNQCKKINKKGKCVNKKNHP